jgi:hypothetical protein
MRMKKFVLRGVFVVGCYLGLTYLFGGYADWSFRNVAIRHMQVLGRNGFIKTDRLSAYLHSDPDLTRFRLPLQLTPPVGWAVLHRLDGITDKLIYASKNMALPEGQRFSDIAECLRFGFDPQKKDDLAITQEAVNSLR